MSCDLGGLNTETEPGRDQVSDEGSVPGVVNSGESSEDDEVRPNPSEHPKGRSRSSSIDLLANAAILKAIPGSLPCVPPPVPLPVPAQALPPPPQHQQHEKRERMDSISSLVEAVEQRSRSDSITSVASTNSCEGGQHKYGTRGRMRSFSNPEGMEKYSYAPASGVIPAAAAHVAPLNRTLQLMEELERRKDEKVSNDDLMTNSRYGLPLPTIYDYTYLAPRGRPPSQPKSNPKSKSKSKTKFIRSRAPSIDLSTIPVVDVIPDPLTSKVAYDSLKQKKEPLLDAMSKAEGTEAGQTYPHAMGGYKGVYNKDGRIGIYTAIERTAILERFRDKRRRRVWVKKIRYDCRKNLADRRIRVKGRFVKMTPEQAAEALAKQREEQRLQQEHDQQQQQPEDEIEIYERTRRYTIG